MTISIDLRFVYTHPAHAIAFSGGVGLAPLAPGTWGTLAAFPLHALLQRHVDGWMLLAVIAALFGLGAWACDRTGRSLGMSDYGGMVWDEIVAFVLILAMTPHHWAWQLFAFFAFRFFDVLKPPPIREADRHWKGGFGVMFDDIIAAFRQSADGMKNSV